MVEWVLPNHASIAPGSPGSNDSAAVGGYYPPIRLRTHKPANKRFFSSPTPYFFSTFPYALWVNARCGLTAFLAPQEIITFSLYPFEHLPSLGELRYPVALFLCRVVPEGPVLLLHVPDRMVSMVNLHN